MKTKLILTIGVIIATAFLALSFSGVPNTDTSIMKLPTYAKKHPMIEEAYTFALSNSEELDGVNCYCGCMKMLHNGRIHSRGLLDCFMIGDSNFETHGSECDMCITDALDVKRMSQEGMTKDKINEEFEVKYTSLRY